MLAKPPPVPSKDTLRVLRQLAFAGSAVATCSIVALNCHIHRRIRLLEQRLEIKRQIRALSNGRGESHLARLIQAAENGEDFTIQAMREKKVREKGSRVPETGSNGSKGSKRKDREVAGMMENESRVYLTRQHTSHKHEQGTAAVISTTPGHISGRSKQSKNLGPFWPLVESKEMTSPGNLRPPPSRSMNDSRGEAAERIKKATMAMTSTAPGHIYGRPRQRRPVQETPPHLHDPVASWLGSTSILDAVATPQQPLQGSRPDKLAVIAGNMADGGKDATEEIITAQFKGSDPIADEVGRQSKDGAPNSSQHDREDVFNLHKDQMAGRSDLGVSSTKAEAKAGYRLRGGLHSNYPGRSLSSFSKITDSAPAVEIASMMNTRTFGSVSVRPLSGLSEIPGGNRVPSKFPVSLDGGGSRNGGTGLLGSTTINKYVDLGMAPKKGDSAALSNHQEAKETNSKAAINSAVKREQVETLNRPSRTEPVARPPARDIGLHPEPGVKHPSKFVSWPYLELLDPSEPFAESGEAQLSADENIARDQSASLQKHAGQRSPTDEGKEVRQLWAPFPRSFNAPDLAANAENTFPEGASLPAIQTEDPQNGLYQLEKASMSLPEDTGTPDQMTAVEMDRAALQIRTVFASDGYMEGQRAWRKLFNARFRKKDLAAMDFLHVEFVEKGVLRLSPRYFLIQGLIQWHYTRDKYSRRAGQILFPGATTRQEDAATYVPAESQPYFSPVRQKRENFISAMRYLQGLWEARTEPDWLMLNFRRVMVAAKIRGLDLVEELFATVIRLLASVGKMSAAQIVFDEMIYYHQIQPSLLTRTVMVRGYARIGAWNRVEREFESVHACGLSRTRPHGFALMVDAVLKEYASRTSVEQFQNFLIKAISYWGLVPISAISVTTVQTYLSQGRYDLVREWMETLRALFPKIETETMSFHWNLGDGWHRTAANCQNIEDAVKALAFRDPATKLRTQAVPLIHEALCRDLAAKIDAARAKIHPGQESNSASVEREDFGHTKTLDEYLTAAFSLTATTVSGKEPPPSEIIDLHHQASAVQRVNNFLSEAVFTEATAEELSAGRQSVSDRAGSDVEKRTATFAMSSLAHLRDSVPTILTSEFLPGTRDIYHAILAFYRHRDHMGLSPDHLLLRRVCEKLLHLDRSFDAVHVIQHVYRNDLVRQIVSEGQRRGDPTAGFGLDFFEFWMRLAWATRSLTQWKAVVEGVLRLDSGGTETRVFGPADDDGVDFRSSMGGGVKITATFLLLARITAANVLRTTWKWVLQDARRGGMPSKEVVWLLRRLQERREQQIGKKEYAVGPYGRSRISV